MSKITEEEKEWLKQKHKEEEFKKSEEAKLLKAKIKAEQVRKARIERLKKVDWKTRWLCSSCDTVNSKSSKYCSKCGARAIFGVKTSGKAVDLYGPPDIKILPPVKKGSCKVVRKIYYELYEVWNESTSGKIILTPTIQRKFVPKRKGVMGHWETPKRIFKITTEKGNPIRESWVRVDEYGEPLTFHRNFPMRIDPYKKATSVQDVYDLRLEGQLFLSPTALESYARLQGDIKQLLEIIKNKRFKAKEKELIKRIGEYVNV